MQLLSKTECSALRGFAILGIFLHNYLHWLKPMVKENEYLYHQNNVDWMQKLLSNPSWDLPLQLFSFFGHYGVPVFLFLSGYGLVLKYENHLNPMAAPLPTNGASTTDQRKPHCSPMEPPHESNSFGDVLRFLWNHYKKLFPMMLLGFVLFAITDAVTPGKHHWATGDLIALLTMTINFLPNPDKIIWPGPYWFFGLMMQLYLIYRLILYKRSNYWAYGAIILCWIIQGLCMGEPEGETLNYIRYNSIGGILPFCSGVIIARNGRDEEEMYGNFLRKRTCWIFLLFSLWAVLLGSFNFHLWLWVPLFVVILHVAAVKLLPNMIIKGLDWLGGLSAAIFVCHPIARKVFIPISHGGNIVDGLLLYIIATILLAMLFRLAISALRK